MRYLHATLGESPQAFTERLKIEPSKGSITQEGSSIFELRSSAVTVPTAIFIQGFRLGDYIESHSGLALSKIGMSTQHEGDHNARGTLKAENAGRTIKNVTKDTRKKLDDVTALKKGEVYGKIEFYKRAKSWYKGKINRLLHLDEVKQPTRAAKRMAAELAAGNNPPKRCPAREKKATASVQPAPIQPHHKKPITPTKIAAPGTEPRADHPGSSEQNETRGDYTLTAYDGTQLCNGDEGEHSPSLDVEDFCKTLETAVEGMVTVISDRDYMHFPAVGPGPESVGDAEGAFGPGEADDHPGNGEGGICRQGRAASASRPVEIPEHALCVGRSVREAAGFEPVAAPASAEEGPRPTITVGPIADASDHGSPAQNGTLSVAQASGLVADVAGKRQDMSGEASPAHEADMEISPTPGRWRRHGPLMAKRDKGSQLEDLGANVVEVLGLKFAVDLCACRPVGGLPGSRMA
ncbi:hypothetical protein N657DRAFT_630852 [Parathielavia appendiculata]|uniref:Uncharacterized protein n=1 Tax=Parathielavia appendiculata TaxID=2587402 RepID=A0AAN6Z7B3_9PEZI|nr:hypothetical protein N657DRAFT_630852 [Parathielavia appendiculata]